MAVMTSDTNNSVLRGSSGYRNMGALGFCYKDLCPHIKDENHDGNYLCGVFGAGCIEGCAVFLWLYILRSPLHLPLGMDIPVDMKSCHTKPAVP